MNSNGNASRVPRVPNMLSVPDSAADASSNSSSATLALLETELGSQAHMLQYLPYSRAEFFDQKEEPDAVPVKLRYGRLKTATEESAFIFLYPAASCNTWPVTKIFTYDSSGVLKEQIPAIDIGGWAFPDAAFEGLVHQQKVLAVAKYYFMKRSVDLKFTAPISKTFKDSVLAACVAMKRKQDEAAAGALAPIANHRMTRSVQFKVPGEPVVPTGPYQRGHNAGQRVLTEELDGSSDDAENLDVDTPTVRGLVLGPFVGHKQQEKQVGKMSVAQRRFSPVDIPDDSSDITVDHGSIQSKLPTLFWGLRAPGVSGVSGMPPPHRQLVSSSLNQSKHISTPRAPSTPIGTQMNFPSLQRTQVAIVTSDHDQQTQASAAYTTLIADLRRLKSIKADYHVNLIQHENDKSSAADDRKIQEDNRVALQVNEEALDINETAIKKREVELMDQRKWCQQEEQRLKESIPHEVRDFFENMEEGEPGSKRQKLG